MGRKRFVKKVIRQNCNSSIFLSYILELNNFDELLFWINIASDCIYRFYKLTFININFHSDFISRRLVVSIPIVNWPASLTTPVWTKFLNIVRLCKVSAYVRVYILLTATNPEQVKMLQWTSSSLELRYTCS